MTATKLPFGLTRQQLVVAMNGNETIARALEQVILTVQSNAQISTSTAAATTDLQDATAVTLSPNAALNNERILAAVAPLGLDDQGPGNQVRIGFGFSFTINDGGHGMVWNLISDTNITFPPSGRLMPSFVTSATYANDAAAAAAGLSIGDLYRLPGGNTAWRQV